MKKSTIISVAVVALSLSLLGLTASYVVPTLMESTAELPSESEEQAYPVEVAEARRGTVRNVIRLNGEVVATTSVDAFPEVAGEVQRLDVQLGSRVRRGQVIAAIDPSRPGARFEANPVEAPITGTITEVYVEEGSTVAQSTPIVAVGQLDALELVIDVPERFVGSVKPGMRAEVRLSAFPEVAYEVEATEISPVLDASTRTKEVRFLLNPALTRAEAGMFAEVEIVTETRADSVVVPVDAIVTRSGEDFLFVVNGTRASRREIEVGLIHEELAEIRSGLEAGERMVVRGQTVLEEDALIQIQSTETDGESSDEEQS